MSAVRRERLDAALVRRGLVRSRAQAEMLILAQQVTVNGALATKSSRLVAPADALQVLGAGAWHPRGYDKLHGALLDCAVDVTDFVCLDVGSSTGGFVSALLDAGASLVVAVDVGSSQLDMQLRNDSRVLVNEQTDIRSFVWPLSVAPHLVTVDVSFISITKIAHALGSLAQADTELLALVKPQFEVDRAIASKAKGVITDRSVHAAVLETVVASLGRQGFELLHLVPSRHKGAKGNQEYFTHWRARSDRTADLDPAEYRQRIADALAVG